MRSNTIGSVIAWFTEKGRTVLNKPSNEDIRILGPKSIAGAQIDHISFIGDKFLQQASEMIHNTSCKLLVVSENVKAQLNLADYAKDIVFIVAPDPKTEIIEFCEIFLGFNQPNSQSQIDKMSFVADTVVLGDNVVISPFVVIEDNCVIGSNVTIGANTVIKKGTVIGDDVRIGSCCVIGGDGFGYSKEEGHDHYMQFPHYGNVLIHDDVHIGNNTCIDRGSLSDTIIEKGVRIDNLVHIAHNVKIGENSLVIANAMVAGSVEIGKSCWVAPNSAIRNGITIGDNVTVGLSSTVTKNVTQNQVVLGNPAIPIEEFIFLRQQQKKMLEGLGEDE